MKIDVVADVGNSRVKFGCCADDRVVRTVSLGPAPEDFRAAIQNWRLPPDAIWALGGVQPQTLQILADFLRAEGFNVTWLQSWKQLPLRLEVDVPENVGLDRLFDALAVRTRKQANHAAVIIDAGSAVTVDLLDADGVFRGGAIFPGLRLMSQALHDYTAKLPVVSVDSVVIPPGRRPPEAGMRYK